MCIYIYIDIENNIELKSIIHLYTLKHCVYNHICITHFMHPRDSLLISDFLSFAAPDATILER